VEEDSEHAHMAGSQKFRLIPVPSKALRITTATKGESRTQHHSHTKLRKFCSTTETLLSIRQGLAFYSNCVMAADLGKRHFFELVL